MAMVQPYHIETKCGYVWTGAGYSDDDRDAKFFDAEEEAYAEIDTLDLQEVFVECFQRYSETSSPKIYNATREREAA